MNVTLFLLSFPFLAAGIVGAVMAAAAFRRRGYPSEVNSLLAPLVMLPIGGVLLAFDTPPYILLFPGVVVLINLGRGYVALQRFKRARDAQGISSF